MPLPFLGVYVVVFVFSGNGAATGSLFEGLIQQKVLSDWGCKDGEGQLSEVQSYPAWQRCFPWWFPSNL